MTANLQSFKEVCNQKIFFIPKNQRGFSWSIENVEDLLKDLELAHTMANSHYVGPIILTRMDDYVVEADDGNESIKYELDDGQQRVTSIFLLLKAIGNQIYTLAGKTNIETQEIDKILYYYPSREQKLLRIQIDNEELNDYLKLCIEGRFDGRQETSSMKSLRAVWGWCQDDFFTDYISNQEKCTLWKNRLLNRAKFIQVNLKEEKGESISGFRCNQF